MYSEKGVVASPQFKRSQPPRNQKGEKREGGFKLRSREQQSQKKRGQISDLEGRETFSLKQFNWGKTRPAPTEALNVGFRFYTGKWKN